MGLNLLTNGGHKLRAHPTGVITESPSLNIDQEHGLPLKGIGPRKSIEIKEHTAVDTDNGFILSTNLSPASHNDSKYLPLAVISSMHKKNKIEITYTDKGYAGSPNRSFLALNNIKDGIMRKDSKTANLTRTKIDRNKAISRYRYIVEQYFGKGAKILETISVCVRAS